jgi:1-acyl-sn-glycerol-3-phosphate acyltransferase
MLLFLRSFLFTSLMFLSVIPYASWVIGARPFGYLASLRGAVAWARLQLWMLKAICGLDYRIEGREHIPADRPVICYIKHSSAWETIAQLAVFPAQNWVLKRELMYIPVLGWALGALQPIHIDRGSGHVAVAQVIEQGKRKLAEGHWVCIFPEGTRMPPGTTRRYGISGALLAKETGTPILPVAHNAGDFWRRNGILKRPGTIEMRVGPLIEPRGRDAADINAEAQAWIEGQMKQLSPGYAGVMMEKKR